MYEVQVIIVKVPSFFPPFTYRLTFSQCRVFCRAEQFVNLIYGPFFFFNLFHTNYIFQSKKDMQSTNLSEFAAPKLLRFRWKLEKISSNQHEIPKKTICLIMSLSDIMILVTLLEASAVYIAALNFDLLRSACWHLAKSETAHPVFCTVGVKKIWICNK